MKSVILTIVVVMCCVAAAPAADNVDSSPPVVIHRPESTPADAVRPIPPIVSPYNPTAPAAGQTERTQPIVSPYSPISYGAPVSVVAAVAEVLPSPLLVRAGSVRQQGRAGKSRPAYLPTRIPDPPSLK